jgi:hypothetical protein
VTRLIAWCLACAIASSLWCLTASARLGATFDEPTYVAAGLDRWRDGRIDGLMRLGAMPLAVDVATLPIRVAELGRDRAWAIATDGRGRVTAAADVPQALPAARRAALVFWWILLGSAAVLAHAMAGRLGAAIAVAFLAAEPSLLAHATLATTDIAVTAFLVAFAASLARERQRLDADAAAAVRWWIPGLWFGLALVSKASAIVFAPLIAVAALAQTGRSWRAIAGELGAMLLFALAIAFAYCGPLFADGLYRQIAHNVRGHDTYLLGQTYARAVWFYFPVTLLIKLSAPVLAGALALAVFRRRALSHWVALACALLLLFSPLYRVQNGVRMVLPLVALAIVALAIAAARAIAGAPSVPAAARTLVVTMALLAWSAAGAARAWPDGIRFANELWGGSGAAYRLVSDADYDWGQGLPELRDWMTRTGRATIEVWYWGADPRLHDGPWRPLDIRALAATEDADILRTFAGRELAVSTTLLHGRVLAPGARIDPADRRALVAAETLRRVLAARSPIDRTRTFLIYDFTHVPSIARATPPRPR